MSDLRDYEALSRTGVIVIKVRFSLRTIALVIVGIGLALAGLRLMMLQATTLSVHSVPGCKAFLGSRELPGGRLSADEAFRLGLPTNGAIRWDKYRNSPHGIYLLDVKPAHRSAGLLHLRPIQNATENYKSVSIQIDGKSVEVVLLKHASFYQSNKAALTPCPVFDSNPSSGTVRLASMVDDGDNRVFSLVVKVPDLVQEESSAFHGGVRVAIVATSLADMQQYSGRWDLKSPDASIAFEVPLRTSDEQFVLTFSYHGADGNGIKSLEPFSQEVLVVE